MQTSPRSNRTVLVRGCGDVGSAVAHVLHGAGYRAAMHDEPAPSHTRRGMAFTDAIFDHKIELAGVWAKHQAVAQAIACMLDCGKAVPISTGSFAEVVQATEPAAIVDARMRKRMTASPSAGKAVVIGLGPNFVAGENADFAIETAWGEELGRVIDHGATRPLEGEPREIEGHARDRYVYAPAAGLFKTACAIGEWVDQGQEVARIGCLVLAAPLSGRLRGLTHSGVQVDVRTKIIEIDPRAGEADIYGIGERPRRIADGVLAAVCRALGR